MLQQFLAFIGALSPFIIQWLQAKGKITPAEAGLLANGGGRLSEIINSLTEEERYELDAAINSDLDRLEEDAEAKTGIHIPFKEFLESKKAREHAAPADSSEPDGDEG